MFNWLAGIWGILPGVLAGIANWKLLKKTFSHDDGLFHVRPGILISGRLLLLFASFALIAALSIDALPYMAGGYTVVTVVNIVRAYRGRDKR